MVLCAGCGEAEGERRRPKGSAQAAAKRRAWWLRRSEQTRRP